MILILCTDYYILACIDFLTVSIVFYHFCVGCSLSTTNKRIWLLSWLICTYIHQTDTFTR